MSADRIVTVRGPESAGESDKYMDMKDAPRLISSSTDKFAYRDDLRTLAEITVTQIATDPFKIGKLRTIGLHIYRSRDYTARDILRKHETKNKLKLRGTKT